MRARPAILLALPLLAQQAAALGAAERAIVLDRPARVGDLATISASCRSRQHRSIQLDERQPMVQDIDYQISFAGEREVMAVDAQGRPTRCRLTVARLERTVAGQGALAMLPPGAQLVADSTGAQVGFSDAQAREVAEPVQQALRLVLDRSDERPLQDQALGSAQRHAADEKWAINPQPAAQLLADLRISVDPAKLSGTASYSEPAAAGEPAQFRLDASLAFSGFTVPALPPGLAVKSSTGTLTIERRYPIAPALPLALERRALTESMLAQGRTLISGHEHDMTLTMELEQSNELHLASAPGAPAR